jgi:hypothetical protein
MDEGDTAVGVAISGHFTPSIDETDDNTAGDENAVYFEDVHIGLLGVCSGTPNTWEYGGRHTALYF